MATDITLYNKVVGSVEASTRGDALKRDENNLRALHLAVELFVTIPTPGTANDHLKAVVDAITTAIGNTEDAARIVARARTTFGVVLRAKDVKADDVYDTETEAKYGDIPHLLAVGHIRFGQVPKTHEFFRFVVEEAAVPTIRMPDVSVDEPKDHCLSFWKPSPSV
jgi:hypothetical protein